MRRSLVVVLVAACGPTVAIDDESSSGIDETTGSEVSTTFATTTPGPTTVATSATTSATTVSTTSDGDTTTTTTDDDDDEGHDDCDENCCAFLCEPDGGGVVVECDVWTQDCPQGEKCMPWANDGGMSWNATRCVPLDMNPAQPGDPCTVEGSGVSGIDDCGISSMCWGVDPTTNEGTCAGFCGGSPADPQCPDGLACFIGFEGTVTLCIPPCDPLAPDCGEDACAFDPASGGFWCVPAVHVGETYYGKPCGGAPFACGSEYVCVAGNNVTNCEGECCTAICDPQGPNTCPEAEFGQICLALAEIGYCGA